MAPARQRTSAIGPLRDKQIITRAYSRGFTLIEILVVVFIIGVILGFATLSLSGRALDDLAQEETHRMQEIFRLARDEAGMTGLEIGWLATEEGYRFVALSDQGWTPYGERGPLRVRKVEAPLQLTVKVENLPIGSDPERINPQILFLSSGEVTPFEVEIYAAALDARYAVTGNLIGQIETERRSKHD